MRSGEETAVEGLGLDGGWRSGEVRGSIFWWLEDEGWSPNSSRILNHLRPSTPDHLTRSCTVLYLQAGRVSEHQNSLRCIHHRIKIIPVRYLLFLEKPSNLPHHSKPILKIIKTMVSSNPVPAHNRSIEQRVSKLQRSYSKFIVFKPLTINLFQKLTKKKNTVLLKLGQ